MYNEKNEISLHQLPRDLIFLIIFPLDHKSLLNFRLVSKAWEQISRYLFISVASKKVASDKIACGHNSVLLVRANGQSWGWGDNSSNQLALPSFIPSTKPIVCYQPQQTSFKKVAKFAVAPNFSVAITKNGKVYSLGNNFFGQLGIGDNENYTVPQLIPNFRATQIVAGNSFVLAISEDRKLYSWGSNDYGQLGLGHKNHCPTPQLISAIIDAEKIAVGDTFSVALTKDEKLYIWGRLDRTDYDKDCHSTPQLVTTLKDIASISAGENFIVTLKNDGKAFTWGRNSEDEIVSFEVPGIENIVKISVYSNSCLALSNDGAVYFWNKADVWLNSYMPRKISGLNNIVEIGQALNASVGLDKNGVLYGWGMNHAGTLGVGKEYEKCNTPQKAWSFEEPVRTKLIKSIIERFTKEQLAKASFKSEQKDILYMGLTFFSSKNENQFNDEVEELKQTLDVEKNTIVQLEEKIDNYLELFKKDDVKKPLYSCLFDMKQTLSTEKSKIAREIETNVETELFDEKKVKYFSK